MTANTYAKTIKEKYPNFTIALGNEIYLTEDRSNGQKYYHFILIAKDKIGYKALKELSTLAWYNIYTDRKLERVPTLKLDLKQIITKYKGHVIATSACMGGELSSNAYLMAQAESVGDNKNAEVYYSNIIDFMELMNELFDDDFYIECAPSNREDQIIVNQKLRRIAQAYNKKIVVGTDAHYLTSKERPIHRAYLNSKEGDREVDSFYEFAHLMNSDEVNDLLMLSYNDKDFIDEILVNTIDLQNKISYYDLSKKQQIPKIELFDYEKFSIPADWNNKYPIICSLVNSNNIQERYWINECIKGLKDKGLYENEQYINRIEIEADIIQDIGNKLNDCLFAYFNTFKHYIDLFWECGSIVGPGRGSATGFLSNYLLGITQLDPIRWDLPYWRFLNKERAELPSLLLILGSCKKRTLTVA